MIKAIEYYINVIHFCLYKAHYKFHLTANKVNPFRLLTKSSFIKNRLQKKGIIDIQKGIDKSFSDKYLGISVMFSGGILIALLLFFFISILNMIIKIFNQDGVTKIHFLFSVLVTLLVFYFLIYRQDKYLIYFEEFELLSKIKKQLYCFFSFGVILSIFFILILSFK
jgi:hypothetical protein